MSLPVRLGALVGVAIIGLGWASLPAPASASLSEAQAAQIRSTSTSTSAPTSTTSTTPDPDLGRRLGVRPPESTGEAIQGGPLWIGAVVALCGAAGIAYALVSGLPRRRAQHWPKRRRAERR